VKKPVAWGSAVALTAIGVIAYVVAIGADEI
jgi:hypothetical protein